MIDLFKQKVHNIISEVQKRGVCCIINVIACTPKVLTQSVTASRIIKRFGDTGMMTMMVEHWYLDKNLSMFGLLCR